MAHRRGTHFRWRSCISRPTRLMTWGEMFSNEERRLIFLLFIALSYVVVFFGGSTLSPPLVSPVSLTLLFREFGDSSDTPPSFFRQPGANQPGHTSRGMMIRADSRWRVGW